MDAGNRRPARAPTVSDLADPRPLYVVWETTLACNLKCQHCGSRAARPRDKELSTEECLSVVAQLHELGTREITLIGGEAYLRRDWLTLIKEIAGRGMLCGIQTGARAFTPDKIRSAAAAGLAAAGVSVDGLAEVHDGLRGVRGSFRAAMRALEAFRACGLNGTVNTQINSANIGELRALMHAIIDAGCTGWQVQLTVAMGRAADRPELLLQPHDMLRLIPLLADLYVEGQRHGLRLMPGNNIGYFGPYEAFWRSITGETEYYGGCNAGRTGLGIEADGTIKGCPSLPTQDYAGGNVRDTPLRELWEQSLKIGFTRDRSANVDRLWGYCRVCYYAEFCQGGCTWTSHVLSGRPGNNPYCHHRALQLEAKGLRERIVPKRGATGRPFDYGLFDIVVEDSLGQQFGQDIFEQDVFSQSVVKEDPRDGLFVCDRCGAFAAQGHTCPGCGAKPGSGTTARDGANAVTRAQESLVAFQQTIRRLQETATALGSASAKNSPAREEPHVR